MVVTNVTGADKGLPLYLVGGTSGVVFDSQGNTLNESLVTDSPRIRAIAVRPELWIKSSADLWATGTYDEWVANGNLGVFNTWDIGTWPLGDLGGWGFTWRYESWPDSTLAFRADVVAPGVYGVPLWPVSAIATITDSQLTALRNSSWVRMIGDADDSGLITLVVYTGLPGSWTELLTVSQAPFPPEYFGRIAPPPEPGTVIPGVTFDGKFNAAHLTTTLEKLHVYTDGIPVAKFDADLLSFSTSTGTYTGPGVDGTETWEVVGTVATVTPLAYLLNRCTNAQVSLRVVGEGDAPITRGYAADRPVLVQRESYDVSDVSLAATAWRESLYNPGISQELYVTWDAINTVEPVTLFLERGTPTSPKSTLVIHLLQGMPTLAAVGNTHLPALVIVNV